ncbi:MAG: hypothetical protein R3280_00890 [Marinobacter sp.]|uniref:hypothetical protein n=1 Tax=Marinobacter sp. TaxID=50741 RepID=UPI00299DB86D|nr:hypothetical protein [Marinobacter sp.]MDX1633168.1 hypothetical protein [Marinobacter sp.]
MIPRLWLPGLLALALVVPALAAEPETRAPEAAVAEGMAVGGIAERSNDEDPRVLTILPWQPPTLPKRPKTELPSEAPQLLAPMDPMTLERHRRFRQTLDPELDSTLSPY